MAEVVGHTQTTAVATVATMHPALTWALSPAVAVVRSVDQRRRKVTALAHQGVLLGDPQSKPLYFLKVTNLSPGREIEITHIWFEREDGSKIHLMNPDRPLPSRLRLDQQYETWVPAPDVAGVLDWAGRFRIKLTSGAVIKSRLNKSVPDVGYVAGGGETPYAAELPQTSPGVTGINPEAFEEFDFGSGSTSASATYEPPPDSESER